METNKQTAAANLTQTLAALDDATPAEKRQIAELAIGRFLAIGSRPAQPGDMEEYDCLRAIIMRAAA